MNHRFISKADEAKQTKIELIYGIRNRKTVIKYPKPDPRDRISDEYDDDKDTPS